VTTLQASSAEFLPGNSTEGSITPSPVGGGGVSAGDLTSLAGLLQLFCLTYFSL